jgi:hypothetical protein
LIGDYSFGPRTYVTQRTGHIVWRKGAGRPEKASGAVQQLSTPLEELDKFRAVWSEGSSRFCSQQPEENGGRIWVVDCIFGSQGSVVRKKRGTFWAARSLRIGNQEQAAGERLAAAASL